MKGILNVWREKIFSSSNLGPVVGEPENELTMDGLTEEKIRFI